MKAVSEQQKTRQDESAQNTFTGLGNPFKLVFEQSQQMQCIVSLDGRILAANNQAKKLSSPTSHLRLVGQRIWNAPWWRPENAVLVKELFKTATNGTRSQQKLELRTASHLNLRYAFYFSPILSVLGQVNAVLIEGQAIKAKQPAVEQNLDNLTGLADQSLLNDYLKGITKRSKNDPGYLFAVLSIKLEGLRNIKNQYGEALENELLVNIARKFRANTRDGDLVARVKEDSFVVVLDRLQVTRNAIDFAQRCLTFLNTQSTLKSKEVKISASIGLAFGDSSSSAEIFLNQANESLETAAQSNSDMVVFGVSQFDQGVF